MTKCIARAGAAMRVNSVLTWLMVDQVGSTSVTSDINGSVGDTVKYSAYGEVRAGGTATDYLYTSQRNEAEIGLDYYVARFYDPVIGHFIQADTIVPEPGSSKAYDRYGYVNNNPVRYNDPSGHCVDGVTTALCIAMAAGAIAGYAVQVGENRDQGMDWASALTTNISGEKILGGALIAGGVIIAAAAVSIGLSAVGVTVGAACADGDCTNETSSLLNKSTTVYDDFITKGFRFSQKTASPNFSNEGSFAGETIGSLSNKLSSGIVSTEKVAVGYVERAGVKLIETTRSALALLRSGIPLEKWNLVDRTGNELVESKITQRLLVNGLNNIGTALLRITGLGKNISSLK